MNTLTENLILFLVFAGAALATVGAVELVLYF